MTGVFMKNDKFVIFDRDGVINIEKSYLYMIEDFEYETGVKMYYDVKAADLGSDKIEISVVFKDI